MSTKKLSTDEAEATPAAAAQPSRTEIIGSINPFDVKNGKDWAIYWECLRLFFKVNGYPTQGDSRRDVFLVLIGDAAYRQLRDLCQPHDPQTLPLDRLTEEMTNHFAPRPSATSERVTFARRRQKEGENAQEFLAALRKLSEYCNYGNALNSQLLTQFTAGLRNTELQSKLLEDDTLTIAVALKRAVAFERAHGEAVMVRDAHAQPDTSKEDTVHRVAKPRYDKHRPRDSTQRDSTGVYSL